MTTRKYTFYSSGSGNFSVTGIPKGLLARIAGGGGGGACPINNKGDDGENSSFNGVASNGGKGGNPVVGGSSNLGGSGGENGSGTATLRVKGNAGESGYITAGNGGAHPFFGGSPVKSSGDKGSGGSGNTYSNAGSSGGGSSEAVELWIENPSGTYSYSVGAGGSGGNASGGAPSGYDGGDGFIEIIEFY